ncbi:sensor histidine kinase [Lapillicoccus jejuensis]|uniref:sensor histidine kinase n=1 Tax=Lapillicoccus jejuensis TaxID=402171 RepID=UPI00114F386D|nr:HAMP domain-containing sensor histidine kinase [Lapillicoccus jejuensis]
MSQAAQRPEPAGGRRAELDAVRRVVRRLAVLSGAVVLAAVVAAAAAVALVFQRADGAATADQLRQTAARSADPSEVPMGTYVVVRDADGRLRSTPDLPAGLPDTAALASVAAGGPPREADVDLDEEGSGRSRSYVVRTERQGDLVVQAVVDRTQAEEVGERLLTSLAVAVAIGAVLAALGAALVARRAAAPLVSTIELQRRFVADASHELRTPLTLISTRAQLLARRLRRQEVDLATTRDVDGLVRDVGVLSGILDDLLLAARPAGERAGERVDLAPVVEGVVDAARPHAATLGVHLVLRGADPGACVVDGVPSALRRAVLALVDGAVDHATSRVDVVLEGSGRHAVVRVVDDGPGLPPEPAERQRLFARFHQARPSRPGGPGGTGTADGARPHHGIGLALVAEVVDAHGGEVHAGERPDGGAGASFELRLPLAR